MTQIYVKAKFERVTLKNDAFLNFVVNQEKHICTILKNLFGSNSMSRKMHKSVELVEAKLGTRSKRLAPI